MELRTYFRNKSVESRLVKAGLLEQGKKISQYTGSSRFYPCEQDSHLVYFKQESVHAPLSKVARGLKPVKISLHDLLMLEQNGHIKQGEGTFGNQGTKFEIVYGSKKESVPSRSVFLTYAYLSIIKIRILGTNLQSVLDCYKKIREGDLGGNWKGAATVVTLSSVEPIEH